MAEVQTTPEIESTPVVATKTVEIKVVEEEGTVVQEETTVTNGIHNGDAECATTEVEVNNVAKAETDEAKEENGVEENGDVANADEHEVVAVAEGGADTDAGTEVVAEEPKEEVPPKVILHQFPPGKEIPSTSPFCLKVETFLKINNIPYENQYGYKMGKKGKLPWIEYNGERKADSKFIIEYLRDKFEADLDNELSGEQNSIGRAVTSMLEENTYWALIYNRYVDNFNEYKKFMAQGAGIGFNVSQKMFQRKMRSNLDGHGLGRHSREEVYKIAEDDLKALSTILGDKEFLLGDKISTFDCAVFGLCANILYSGMDTPMKVYIKENAINISDLCDKIKESYWENWDDVVEAEKAEPALKKGFSFRKKKTKAPKKEVEATNGESEGAAVDDATTEETPDEKPADGDAPPSEEAQTEEGAAEVPAEVPAEEAPSQEAPTEETKADETPAETPADDVTSENKETTEPVLETKPDEA